MTTPVQFLLSLVSANEATKEDAAVADEEEQASKPSIGRLLDLTVFFTALDIAGSLESTIPEAKDLRVSGMPLANKYQQAYVAEVNSYLMPLFESWGLRAFKQEWKRLERPRKGADVYAARSGFVLRVLDRLRTKPDLLRQTFTDGRHLAAAKKLAEIADVETPLEKLKALTSVPPVGNLPSTRFWAKSTAKSLGITIPEFDETLADVTQAADLGHQVKNIDVQLAHADEPSIINTLKQQRTDIVQHIHEVAESSPNPQAVLNTALESAKGTADTGQLRTKTGKNLALNPQQEDAMVADGKVVIAAGAGSGKTRVLAGKVVYLVKEKGVPAASVLATSFTRKAATELLGRINKYAGTTIVDRRDVSFQGFGTTHAISAKLMRWLRPDVTLPEGSDGYDNAILRIAIAQVSMTPETAVPTDPTAESFFAERFLSRYSRGGGSEPQSPGVPFNEALQAGLTWLSQEGPGLTKFQNQPWVLRWKESNPSYDIVKVSKDIIQQAMRRNLSFSALSEKQQKNVLNTFKWANVAFNPEVSASVVSAAGKPKKLFSEYKKRPANQFFNIGDEKIKNNDLWNQEFLNDFTIGKLSRAMSIWKGNLVSPSEAWSKDKSLTAAAYAAYEWLKENDPAFEGKSDSDDLLINFSRLLIADPKSLGKVQQRFKHVLVDEAQDLNNSQHMIFGLITGYVNPETKATYPDGRTTAETYALIGDDKQCIDSEALVSTPDGPKKAKELKTGYQVISYRNGKNTSQLVKRVVPSSWEYGYRITTDSGTSLTMSPNHRLWATEPKTRDDQMVVYLMYRKDMGFRVGITNKGKATEPDDYHNSYGGRAFLEKAERLWVLEVVGSREEALLQEQRYSLKYGVPTMVFNGEHRGVNQNRISSIFTEFGKNGSAILEAKHLSFHQPHWMSQSYSKHGRARLTISLIAHSGSNSQVCAEWTGSELDHKTKGFGVTTTKNDRRRLRRWFANYCDALAFAEEVSQTLDAPVAHKLSTPYGQLREITASGLFVGMKVPVEDGEGISLEEITSVEKVKCSFVDLEITDAANFYANGILTHNSIYAFRGANVQVFINNSNLRGGKFNTKFVDVNYRSGRLIVDAANHVISHNSEQIPMVCKASDHRGEGAIRAVKVFDASEAARRTADAINAGMSDLSDNKYIDYGILTRTNQEAYAYAMEMLRRGIPYRSKFNPLKDMLIKSVLNWTMLIKTDPKNTTVMNAVVLAVLEGLPKFGIGKDKFEDRMNELTSARGQFAGMSYYDALVAGAWSQIYVGRASGMNDDNVMPFMTSLKAVKDSGITESRAAIDFVLANVVVPEGGTFLDILKENVKQMDDKDEDENRTKEMSDEDALLSVSTTLKPIYDLTETHKDLVPYLGYIKQLRAANEKLGHTDDGKEEVLPDAVVVDTVHGWKGLEAKHVFVTMTGGSFPDKRSDIQDERRLAYVAITRGQDSVTIWSPENNVMKKPVAPSQFISEACLSFVEDKAQETEAPKPITGSVDPFDLWEE